MENLTQKDRVISIRSPLGEDFLLLNKVRAEEKISELFTIDVELVYHEREDDKFDIKIIKDTDIVGQTVSIKINQDDEGVRIMTGLVNSFNIGGRTRQFTYYYATIVPHIWLLTHRFQSRIFQQKTVKQILREIFDGFQVKFELKNDYKPRNYCVQYQETDFDFASRLMEEEGIYYYFEHTAEMDILTLRDDFTKPEDCPRKYVIGFLNENLTESVFESAVKKLQVDYKMQSGKVTLWDYNFELQPNKKLDVEKTSVFEVGENKKLEIYEYPGGYARKYDGTDPGGGERSGDLNNIFTDNKRTINNRMFALDSQYKIFSGISDCSTLTVGHRFELKNHPNSEYNKKYIILSVKHEVDQAPAYAAEAYIPKAYRNEFTCIEHGAGKPEYRPPQKTRKPIMYGCQTAIVVGDGGEEIFTDKYGRVKVQFHWDREGKYNPDSSCWLRVGTSIAGNKWGTMFIPRVGQEVIVDFIGGNPDQPIIVGSVYNPQTMPHYKLPKYKTLSYYKSRTTPDDGKGFNEWRFEDKKGKEQVFIHSQKRMDVRVRQSLYETCGGNRHEVIGVRSNTYSGENYPGGNLAVTVGGNYDLHVKDSMYIGIDKKRFDYVEGDVTEQFKGKRTTKVSSSNELNAQKIELQALTEITFKVGSSFIMLDLTGITISGPLVKINSGGAAADTAPFQMTGPADAEAADTGEPGYLDRPHYGGGHGRKTWTVNGYSGPEITYDPATGNYQTGSITITPGTNNPNFQRDTLNDIAIINSTQEGKKTIDSINSSGHGVTIRERAPNPADPFNAETTHHLPDATNGTGHDSEIDYDPTVFPVPNSADPNSKTNAPSDVILHHELSHADHSTHGTVDLTPRADDFDTNEELNTIGNPDGPDNRYRDQRGVDRRKNHADY